MPSYSQILGRSRFFRGHTYLSRLPEHYYKHLVDLERPGVRVHDDEEKGDLVDYKFADKNTGRITRVPNTPISVMYPKAADEGLWGGEGIVEGLIKPRIFYGQTHSRIFFPDLYKAVVYSEILDKYMSVTVTKRALDLIDNAEGLDNYLLKTPVQDFKSRLALHLRRKLLISLAKEDYYPDDTEKQKYIKEKYKDHVIPLEVAEYHGLSLSEAVTKLKNDEGRNRPSIPLKVKFARELIEELERKKQAGEIQVVKEPFYKKLSMKNIFSKSKQPEDTS